MSDTKTGDKPAQGYRGQRTRGSLTGLLRAVSDVIDQRSVRSVYQPLMDLQTGEVVGYEALARGPIGSLVESPLELFAAAETIGRTVELDWVCRAAAYRGALKAGLDPSLTLFVNNEPTALGTPCPDDLLPAVTAAEAGLRIVSEMTERALATDPAELLAAVARARAVGWGVALDDVGTEPASLAFMPFVRPDVVKLDLRLIQARTDGEIARIVNAVLAETEASGATILAEGIETERHLAVALSMGATVGQGWLWGRPDVLPAVMPSVQRSIPLISSPGLAPGRTPYDVVTAQRPVGRSTKQLLLPMSNHIEGKGLDVADPMLVLACFQDARHFTPATQLRYATLAERATFVAAVGTGMPDAPMPGVRGAALTEDDPLRGEWDVIVVGAHFAAALVARDLGDTRPDQERRFDFAITHDRALVIEAAASLLARISPLP